MAFPIKSVKITRKAPQTWLSAVLKWYGSVEAHSVVIHLLREIKTLAVEMPHPPIPRVAVAPACIASSGAPLPPERPNEEK